MLKRKEELSYMRGKTKPFVIAAIKKHGKRRAWQICRDVDDTMTAPPAHSTVEKLLVVLTRTGDLTREKIDREWVYSVAKRG